jgi:hypothetical protein
LEKNPQNRPSSEELMRLIPDEVSEATVQTAPKSSDNKTNKDGTSHYSTRTQLCGVRKRATNNNIITKDDGKIEKARHLRSNTCSNFQSRLTNIRNSHVVLYATKEDPKREEVSENLQINDAATKRPDSYSNNIVNQTTDAETTKPQSPTSVKPTLKS